MKHVYPKKRNPTFLESKIVHEYHRQQEIFVDAQKNNIESVMLSCLATMNSLVKILGYIPEANDD